MSTGSFDESLAAKKARSRWKSAEPGLVDAICSVVRPDESLIDLGAGNGRYLRALQDRGYDRLLGLDGTPGVSTLTGGLVWEQGIATPLWETFRCDWILTIEVGEHIPEFLASVFLENIARCCRKGAVVSWALPGQRGRGHVNCRSPEWVAAELERRGLSLDKRNTIATRNMAGGGWVRKLLIFSKLPVAQNAF